MDSLRFDYDYAVEGVILFAGLKPIPEEYHHGRTVPSTLIFFDHNENEICRGAELFVDRTWKRKHNVVRPKSGLHDPVEIPETREAIVSHRDDAILRTKPRSPLISAVPCLTAAEQSQVVVTIRDSVWLLTELAQGKK